MKKQLLIAAVAATMTSVAFADISITGSAKVNYTNTDTEAATKTDSVVTGKSGDVAILSTDVITTSYVAAADASTANEIKHELDLNIVGKSGDTSVVLSVSNDNSGTAENNTLKVENSYVTTSIAGVNIKTGQYAKTSDTLLTDHTSATGYDSGKVSLDTTVSGIKLQYEDKADTAHSYTVSGEVAGVNLSHEINETSTDTKLSTELAGVSIAYRSRDYDAANMDAQSLLLSTQVSGMTFTYAMIDTDAVHVTTAADAASLAATAQASLVTALATYNTTPTAANLKAVTDLEATVAAGDVAGSALTSVRTAAGTVNADAFIAGTGIMEANAFGVSMPLAGNTVAIKHISITDAVGEDTSNKIIVTRPLANGTTFEATYTDTDNASTQADTTVLDLELAVKF